MDYVHSAKGKEEMARKWLPKDEIEYRPLALATAGALIVGGIGCLSWMGCVWLVAKHPDMAVLLIHVLAVAVFSLTAWISSKPKMRVWR